MNNYKVGKTSILYNFIIYIIVVVAANVYSNAEDTTNLLQFQLFFKFFL